MRPSSWHGVGAIAKVPAAWAVSFVIRVPHVWSFRDGPKDQTADAQLRVGESRDSGFDASHRPGMTFGHFFTLLASILTVASSSLVENAVLTSNGFSIPR